MASWKTVRRIWLLAFAFCMALMLSGCISFIEDLFSKDPDWGASKAEWFEGGEPKISEGLVLRIGITAAGTTVVDEMVKEVNQSGEILMSLVGAVKCKGLTIFELQKVLEEVYANFFHDPQATVSFAYVPGTGMKSPWGTVLVMGAIGREGPVDMPSTRDLKVTRALMLSGGVSGLGDKRRVRVSRRAEDGQLTLFKVNVKKIAEQGRPDLDIPLMPGDVVWVPETWY